jgi:3-oxoacyl-[acyl-carrier protein] reductase
MSDYSLRGKNVLISGGTHGIGKEIGLQLRREGCNVNYFSRDSDKVSAFSLEAGKLYGIGGGLGYTCDVLKEGDIQHVLDSLKKYHTDIDILINNIGGGGRWGSDFLTTKLETWEEVYQKNMGSAIELTRGLLPDMLKNKWGRVITISSILGMEADEESKPWFVSAKAAEIAFMKCLSKKSDYASNNITFNTVCPGATYIEGTGWDTLSREELQKFTSALPLKRMVSVQEVANMVVFLCTEMASGINGSCITVDGGESSSI